MATTFDEYLRARGLAPPPPPVRLPAATGGSAAELAANLAAARRRPPPPAATPPPPVPAFQPGNAFLAGATAPTSVLSGNPFAAAELGKRYVERRAATAPPGPGGPLDPGELLDVAVDYPLGIAGATTEFVTNPSGQAALGVLESAIPKPARPVLQKPQEFVATKLGELAYAAATGQGRPAWIEGIPFAARIYDAVAGMAAGDAAKRQKIVAAYEAGGGLAAFWGGVADTADMGPVSRFVATMALAMLTDPWTYAPVLAAGGKSIETAGTLSALERGGPGAATAGDTARIVAGQALQVPNTAANVLGGLPFEAAGLAARGIGNRIPAAGRLLEPSERARAQARDLEHEDLFDVAAGLAPDETPPPGATGATPPRPEPPPTNGVAPEPPGEYAVVQMGPKDFRVVEPTTGRPVVGADGRPVTFETHRIAQADADRRTGVAVATEPAPPDVTPAVAVPEPETAIPAVAVPEPAAFVPVTPTGALREHWINPAVRATDYVPGETQPSLPEFVAHEVGRVDRPLAEAWWREVETDPRTAAFVEGMAGHDAEAQRVARAEARARGRNPATVRGVDTPEKTLTKVAHTVEVQRTAYRDLTGAEPPPFRFDHGADLDPVAANPVRGEGRGTRYRGVADERNLIEHAVFGSDEEAARAREYWHVRAGSKALDETERRRAQALLDETTRLRQLDAPGRATEAEPAAVAPPEVEAPLVPEVAPPAAPDALGEAERRATEEIRRIGEEPPARVRRLGGAEPGAGVNFAGDAAAAVGDLARRAVPALPGEIAAAADETALGRAFNAGEIGRETYEGLNRTIAVGGEPIRVYDLIRRELAAAGGERTAALAAVRRAVAVADGVTARERGALLRALDTGLTAYREHVMFNPANVKGAIGDQLGDMLAMTVTGSPEAAVASLNLGNAVRWWRYGRGAARAIEDDARIRGLNRYGVKVPRDLLETFQRTETPATGEMTATRGAMALEKKLGLPRTASRITPALAAKWTRDLRTALDRNRRLSLYWATFRREVPEARATLVGLARRAGGDELAAAIRGLPEEFSAAEVLRATGSEQLARQWRGLVNRAGKRADEQVGRALFTYQQTNLDAKLKYALVFHYWMSRALVLHTRAALENPGLLNAYWRAFEGLKRLGEEEGLPGPLRTYFKFMGEVGGWYSVADPIGALVPYTIFRDLMATDPRQREGERTFDRLVRKSGLMLSPLVEVGATLLGQSDRVPDPTGSWAVRGLVKTTLDYARNHGLDLGVLGPGITRDPVSYFERRVFETASALADRALVPFAEKIGYWDDRANEQTQVLDVLKEQMAAEYGPFDGWSEDQRSEYLAAQSAILTDGAGGNARAEAALAAWSAGKARGRWAGVAIPGGVQTRYGPRDERIAAKNAGYAALDVGTEPTAAQRTAMAETGQINAGSPAAASLTTAQDLYRDLGTDRQQQLADGWRIIAYGTYGDDLPFGSAVRVGGTLIQAYDLIAMSDVERRALADRWVAEVNGADDLAGLREEQDAFKVRHVDYAAYVDWTNTARDYPGGVARFRADLTVSSPGYKKYLKQLPRKVLDDPAALDRASISVDAYLASRGEKASIYGGKPGAAGSVTAEMVANLIRAAGVGGGGKQYPDTPAGRLARLKDNLADYQAKMRVYDDAVKQETGGMTIDQLPPQYGEMYRRRLETKGIQAPSRPETVRVYLDWRQAVLMQDPSADTSPEAFSAWFEAYRAQAVA